MAAGVVTVAGSSAGNAVARMRVRVAPGLMQFTLMLLVPSSSWASTCDKPSMANFETA